MMEWLSANKYNPSEFMKKRWTEHRDEMVAICCQGGQVKGKIRPPLSEDVKKQISETLKRKGCHPPWELSPMHKKGVTKAEILGLEVAEKMRQTTIEYNHTRTVTTDSRIKMSEAKKGENNPGWKGGITTERQRVYNTLETKEWRRTIFERDHYTCRQCGGQQYLNAHHKKAVSEYPELRFNIDNGITLCLLCHKATNSYGGKWLRC